MSASVAVSFDSSFVVSASSFLSSSVAFTSFSSVLATVSFVSSFGAATSSFFSWAGATVSVLGASTFVSAGFLSSVQPTNSKDAAAYDANTFFILNLFM
mgnify:FL=1